MAEKKEVKTRKPRKKREPQVPWSEGGTEIIEPGIGQGFVEWNKHGDSLRGKLLHRWQSRAMKSPAVTIELTEAPNVTVINTEGSGSRKVIKCTLGDLVNVSLSYDLSRKLTADLEGSEVGLFYQGDQVTPKGSMRVFKVYHFEQAELPF